MGWDFLKLVQVLHQVANNHPRLLIALICAIDTYGRKEQVDGEDGKAKWAVRWKSMGARLHQHDPDLTPDPALFPLMELLFPEVSERTRR